MGPTRVGGRTTRQTRHRLRFAALFHFHPLPTGAPRGGGRRSRQAPPLNARRGVPVYREPSHDLVAPACGWRVAVSAISRCRLSNRSPLYAASTLSANRMSKRQSTTSLGEVGALWLHCSCRSLQLVVAAICAACSSAVVPQPISEL